MRMQDIKSRLERVGIPKRYWELELSDFEGLPKEWRQGYFFTGNSGTGKTALACVLAKEVIKGVSDYDWVYGKSKEFGFITVPDFLLEIETGFKGRYYDEMPAGIIEKYASIEYLILDDLGAERSSEWVLEHLYILLNRREQNCRDNIIITSNLSLDELSGKIGDRITSRISGMTKTIRFTGKDRRLNGNR